MLASPPLSTYPAMFGLALIANEFMVTTITAKWQACVLIMQILCILGSICPHYLYVLQSSDQ